MLFFSIFYVEGQNFPQPDPDFRKYIDTRVPDNDDVFIRTDLLHYFYQKGGFALTAGYKNKRHRWFCVDYSNEDIYSRLLRTIASSFFDRIDTVRINYFGLSTFRAKTGRFEGWAFPFGLSMGMPSYPDGSSDPNYILKSFYRASIKFGYIFRPVSGLTIWPSLDLMLDISVAKQREYLTDPFTQDVSFFPRGRFSINVGYAFRAKHQRSLF